MQNPRLDKDLKTDICYNQDPLYIGSELWKKSFLFHQYGIGVQVQSIPSKKVAIICPKSQFDVKVLDYCIDNLQKVNSTYNKYLPTDSEYVLLFMESNENTKSQVPKESLWNNEFASSIQSNMKANITGNQRHNKHKKSCQVLWFWQNWYTYAVNNSLSTSSFAGNSIKNSNIQNLIPILKNDVSYMIERHQCMIPLPFYL